MTDKFTETPIGIAFCTSEWRSSLDRYLAERAHGMNSYMLNRSRLASVARLHLLSDKELAEMGLTRDEIPAFVFEDILPG
ncbi:DUF1127 domain-containing protein [Roseovarius sp. 2305UL8-3]|uniref:DUF1127 domain-containing protein n=1 Tax=Roseovarius conchicola TaxID=3121636 RepID=UPI003527542D